MSQIKNDKLEKTVSFSGIDSYLNCQKFFEEKYINKIKVEKTIESHFIIGSWAHELIEEKIRNTEIDLKKSLYNNLPLWLGELKIELENEDYQILTETIIEYSELLYRASPKCVTKKIAIRTKDGSALKDPLTYPSSSFLTALKNMDNYKNKSKYDIEASKQQPAFLQMSLVGCLADAFFLANYFKIPSWVYKTIGIELAFGINEATRLNIGDSTVSLLGFIDWVIELEDGNICIIDHKSSKITSKPSPLEVIYHPQLNLYAYAFEQIFGKQVSYIGINHLRSGDIIIAETDKTILQENYNHFEEVFNSSQTTPYLKRRPTDFMTPCIKKDMNTTRIKNVCPYLNKCWPNFYDSLNLGLALKNSN